MNQEPNNTSGLVVQVCIGFGQRLHHSSLEWWFLIGMGYIIYSQYYTIFRYTHAKLFRNP